MSRRKQTKPRHFDTEVDDDADPRDGVSVPLVDEEMVSLAPSLGDFTLAMMTSSRASSIQADCEEPYQSELTRAESTGQDYVSTMKDAEESRLTTEEEGEGEEEDDGEMEGEDAEAMYDYFMSRQSSGIDADNSSVTAETMAADLKDCTNVKLKTIENTKVAVAQFAENNIAPADYLMLQSTLYNLQQQQLFQLQLLQQIQQQLVSGVSPTTISNLRQLTSHPASTHPVPIAIPPLLPMSNVISSGSGPLTSVSGALSNYNDRESKYTMAHMSSTSLSMSPLKMLSSLKTPSSITTPTADLLPLPHTLAVTSSSGAGSDSSQFGKAKSPSVTVSGTVLPREQYAADDPFFKHKCRFCHKVFGSDSALQIHIRSHTGERPYKCNICANRFSTKGNLKVHFARHKASYPDVKMNATMFPEHLDRPAKLAPSGASTATSLPVVSPLAANHSAAFNHMSLGSKEKIADDPDDRPSQHGDSASQLGDAVLSNEASRTSFMDEQSVRPSSVMSSSRNETPVPANTCSPALSSRSSTSSPAMTPTASSQSLPMACLSSMVPPMPQQLLSSVAPTLPPFGFEPLPFYSQSQSILPTPQEDPMEQFMEIQKSETSKLEQLVKNIESKLTDPNQCAICHRILSCKSALLMHYRTHTGERPFKCKICGRAFTTKGNLKTHMGVHRAKPPVRMMHQCPVCHKQFTNALVLQQHVRMHTGELPKDFALHNDMLAASAAMNYMAPFPGFPFMPLPPAGLPQHPIGAAGELDLRKPKMEGHYDDRERQEEAKEEYVTPGKRRSSEESNRETWSAEGSNNEDSNGVDAATYKRPKLDDEVKSAVSESDRESEVREKDAESTKDGETEDDSSGQMPPTRRPSSAPHASTPPALVPLSQVLSANKPEMIYPPYSHPPLIPMSYSTSLMAMEDRIRSIDMTAPHFLSMGHPLEGMENIIRRAETHMTLSSHVPRSENHLPAAMTSMPRPPSGGDRRSPTEDSATAASPSIAMSPGDSGSTHMERNGVSELSYSGSATQSFLDETANTTCNVCFKTFACKSALDIHYRSHSNERPFKCEACDRSFSTYGNMKQHLLTHKIRDLPTDAFDAQSKTNSMEALATSTPLKGTEPTMSRSEDATASLHTPKPDLALPRLESMKTPPETDGDRSLTKHKVSPPSTSSDNSQSPFVRRPNLKHMCLVCQKPFSSASALQIHMRTHTGDKPFKCTVCGKAFTTKGNLKVHMGTHMWNNSPSRRGRRMSIDPRPSLTPTSSPKDAEFFSSFVHHPPPDMYPFPFPPAFPNGFLSPKMNEISVIQGLNGGINPIMPLPPTTEAMLGHFPASFAENMLRSQFAVIANSQQHLRPEEHPLKASDSARKPTDLPMNGGADGDKQTNGASGELDLSIRKSGSSTPSSISSSLEQHSMDAAHNATWIWKTTCHLCSKVCSSASALEMHMKGHLQAHNEELTSKPLVA